MTRAPRSAIACCVISLLGLGPVACSSDPSRGYSFRSEPAFGVRSVHVATFRNRTLTTGLEATLTEAIIKQIQSRTGMVVTGAPDDAESTLSGEITGVEMRRLSVDSTTGLVQELAMVVTIDFTWSHARSGRVLVSRKRFSSVDTFVPARPTGERIQTGENAVLQRLAQDVVSELRDAW